jgi:hypothetical protein
VGNPETIEARTGLFFVMLVMSVATAVASIGLAKRLMPQHGAWNAWIAGGTDYVVVMAVAHYALPPVNEVPEQFSAVVLWNFRVASLGIQAVLWTAIGLMFGAVAERKLVERRGRQSVVRAASH